ncbi:MAG: T9SS type A sorting domain-containing protein [Saprospirales bacterium]|nr:T9SS type A sorting domain-containing protein [Saprospirales bacterium]
MSASAPTCRTACVTCDLKGLEDKNNIPVAGAQTVANCGVGAPFTLENPRWYAFIAGSTILQLDIRQFSCSANAGLEGAIIGECNDNLQSAIFCAGGGNPLTLVATNLVVGNRYFLLIDGINGDVCSYVVDVVLGSTVAPELGDLAPIQGLTQVCPKATVSYTVPPVQYALSYTWIAPPGSKINNGTTNVVTVAAQNGGNTVSIQFGPNPVGGTVCVTASNVCDTPKTTCLQIFSQALPVTILPDLEICFEQLPYFWEEEPGNFISAPGTYTFTSTPYSSYLGCDSTVRQKIIARPRKFKVLPPTYLCEQECLMVGGTPFCDAGTYQEVLLADNGCDSTVTFTLIKVPARAGILPPDTITCRVKEVTLSKDNTTTVANTVTYKWIDGQGNTISTGPTATVSVPGAYSFIVTNYLGGKGCADTATVQVPGNLTAPVANAGPNRTITCENPVIQLQGSGSTGSQFTYLWLAFNGGNIVSGSTTLTPTVNATGTYRLRVTNEINGCTQTDNTIVSANTLPPTLSATGGTFSCVQPTVTLQSATNAAGPTYAWSGPNNFSSTAANPVVNAAGQYTVVVTDSISGCSNTAIATVIANTAPPGATALGGVLTCVEDTVILSGTSPASNPGFGWTGPNGFTAAVANPAVSAPGDYLLTVTAENGCTSTATAVVALNITPPGAMLSVSANLNCNNATVNITASSNAPASFRTHVWTRPDGSTVSTGPNPILSANAPGLYSVVVTNTENGCTSTANITVVQNPPVSASIGAITNIACSGQQTGSATANGAGGNGAYTYLWNNSNNTTTASNLGPGTYTVTVTDGELCTATASATITQPELLAASATATPQMANGAADGTASANPSGGTVPYAYLWDNTQTAATITGLLPGVYTVTVTDANGCTAVSVATVIEYNCTIDISLQANEVRCFDGSDGTATASINSGVAPFTYAWSTGDTTATISNLPPGVYTVVVTDAANCQEAQAVTISEPNLLKVNATAVNMTGPATGDGSATASPTGGRPAYTFLWSNGEMTETIDSLAAGVYTVTVTETNGCTAEQTVEVRPGNCGITVNFIAAPVVCNGQSNGAATVVPNGGAGPFSYLWSSGGTTDTEPALGAGTYTVTITDANGCDLSAEVTIAEPPLLTLTLDTVIHTACPNLPEGSATVIAAGGTSPIAIYWSNGQTGPTADGLIAGTYTVTVADDNECKTTLEVTVVAIDNEAPVIAGDSLLALLGPAGNVTLSAQALGLDVSDNCGIQEVTFQPGSYNCAQLGPHNVEVTAVDDAGNTTTDTIVVIVADNLPPTLVCPASIIRCFGNNVVQYTAPVATDNCLGNGGMFDLISGFPSGASFPPGTTTNTYTYTDADGNVGSCTFEVTILTQLQLELDTILPDKGGLHLGGVHITVGGSLSPYTFQWFLDGALLPNMTEDLDSVGSGAYSVIITDEVGCSITGGPYVVDSLVNTQTPDWGHGLLVIPNPTTGRLAVIFPAPLTGEVQLTVFDMTGRLVLQQASDSPKRVDVDLSTAANGLYTVLIRVNREVLARKIVVSR